MKESYGINANQCFCAMNKTYFSPERFEVISHFKLKNIIIYYFA
ncbi:hypothetical protein CHCC15075_1334 [Bacillus licheniformis]|uniref:Uncharacterized protein n=1 Tax=Bacillus licheniformis TaxID=1402 RepID=A0A8B5YFB6_BACLI|nr:hypothetical protein B4091_4742 [Bacillus licheniformis]TWN08232.1 hypothetical protein CHCC14564_2744 [Bacillus licheniformis LMG 17339]KYC96001.1 hypothetical protein B4164_4484 [Bacillus licheniformis]OLF92462.1 hypothetical protein B4089_2173 [Bacillus licheniformis]OLG03203.1 hypothetical protein B4124_2531 [Bacillus licheniformis]